MRAAERIGSVVASKYRLDRLLGEGGMGAVFCATHLTVRKEFAIKLLHPEMSKHPDAKRRFTQEAQAAARIGHPAILEVYDLGETDDGSLYMVMKLLTGESLAERVARGPLPISEALRHALDVLTALEAAHEAGIIHRDIKPANVFLVEEPGGKAPSVRVLDFGIAKFLETADGAKTNTGAVLGSPHYMAPEQVRADPEIDARVDVWAVGAMLYELLVGEPAHLAPTHAAVIVKIVMTPAPLVSARRDHVDATLDGLVARALSIDPAQRFASASEMRSAIEAYLVERAETIASVPPPSLKRRSSSGGARGSGSGDAGGSGGAGRQQSLAAHAATTDSQALGSTRTRSARSLVPLAVAFLAVSATATVAVLSTNRPSPTGSALVAPDPASAPPVPVPVPETSAAPAPPPPSASASASASASPPAPASAPTFALVSTPSSPAPSPSLRRPPAPSSLPRPLTCPAGQDVTNGHCCVRGFIWQDGRCERDIAQKPPF